MAISVIIPAYQSADSIGQTIHAVRIIPGVSEVIVVDDSSSDGTADVARSASVDHVIRLPRNKGKGAALAAGVEVAQNEQLLLLDADLGASAVHASSLVQAVSDNPHGMAIAVLPKQIGGGGFGLAKGLASLAIRLFTGMRVAAPLSGQRALSRSLVKHIGLAPRFGVETGLTVEAFHLGAPIVELPLPFEHRITGRSFTGFVHRASQFKDILRFALLIGYGIGWPALSRTGIYIRATIWLIAFAILLGISEPVSPAALVPLFYASLASLVLWLPSLWITAIWLGLRKANYLGRCIPASAGLLFPLIALPIIWFSPLLDSLRWSALLCISVLGTVGLADDMVPPTQARGLKGHLHALVKGRLTTGMIKAVAGLAVGLAAGVLIDRGQPGKIVLDALLIALSANLLNLLDLRPSRALKGWGVLSAIMIALDPNCLLILGPLLAASIVLAPADFAGRVMMGDVGANVLGGVIGLTLAIILGPWHCLAAIMVLMAIHIWAELHSLSDLIARTPWLNAIDRLGTRHL